MRYSILSTVEYVSGRILLFASRFDNVFTGNNEQSPEFCRSCLQWASNKTDSDILSILTVTNGSNDGGYRVLDLADKVTIRRGTIEDLSDTVFLSNFDTVCVFGIDNNLSPLINLTLKDYVSNGGGLILSDIHVEADYIDFLATISPVYCESSGINFLSGKNKWTSTGVGSNIFVKDFYRSKVQILNTIPELDLDPSWSVLYVYDTLIDPANDEDVESDVSGPVYISSDYDISGNRIVGYFSGLYKKGIMNIDENS